MNGRFTTQKKKYSYTRTTICIYYDLTTSTTKNRKGYNAPLLLFINMQFSHITAHVKHIRIEKNREK